MSIEQDLSFCDQLQAAVRDSLKRRGLVSGATVSIPKQLKEGNVGFDVALQQEIDYDLYQEVVLEAFSTVQRLGYDLEFRDVGLND